ncbi:hypothetical protein Ddye_004068 [Dipteronia dyeriana]|uniref:Endonuclease/exonuclease/phosphatase domain-containing protein n=1 Tax=Dipteronia dyeriana TaxID=168575 RepID=A0AAD9XTG8_9ROSI|nr:hypothetical protein Ddye_004068 [Dipteronia dyeriana]
MVRGLMRRLKPEIMFLQESKLKVFDSRVISSAGGSWLSKGVGIEVVGASGDLITLWSEDFFKVEACILNQNCIILQSFVAPWCVAGDFNTVLDPSERVGRGVNLRSIRSFNRFLHKAGIVDIPLTRSKFTWSNNRSSEAWSRLDHFLFSPIILTWFPNLIQIGLPRCLSDHNPVMIGDSKMKWGPYPFHFFNYWLEEKEMMKDSIKGWKECVVSCSKGFVFFSKAKASKTRLKSWIHSKKLASIQPSDLEHKLALIDIKTETDGWI